MRNEYSVATGKGTIHIIKGDITEMTTDAIVNAANEHLILGAGVAGAIKIKGGPSIQEECDRKGGTYVGGAIITGAGNLPVKNVIHAVGPRMGEGNEDEKLRNAVFNSLELGEKYNLESIAFPAISTGIFGYPIEKCARIIINEAKVFLQNSHNLRDIYFVLWDETAYSVFIDTLKEK